MDETDNINDEKVDNWILNVPLCTLISIEWTINTWVNYKNSFLTLSFKRKEEYNGARTNRNDQENIYDRLFI